MNRVLLILSLIYLTTVKTTAQDLISKIPKDASAVITLKGKNITDLLSVKEFENSRLGKVFLKEIKRDTDGKITNLEGFGLDLNRNFYYFLQTEEGVLRHNFLVPLKNKEAFLNLLSEKEEKKIVTDNNISYFVDQTNTITMWNDNSLLVVHTQQENKYNDYSYDESTELIEYATEGVVEEEAVVEYAEEAVYPIMTFTETEYDFGNITEGDVVEHSFKFINTGDVPLIITVAKGSCGCTVPSFPKEPIASGETAEILVKFNSKGKLNKQSKTVTISTNTEGGVEKLKIKAYVYEKGEDVVEETVVESIEVEEIEIEETVFESTEYEGIEETVIESTVYNNNYNSKNNREEELKRIEAQKKAIEKLVLNAKATMAGNYASILKNTNYVKSIGKGTDEITAWINDFNTIYEDIMPLNMFGLNSNSMFDIRRIYGGTSLVSNLNFEEDNASIKTKYTMNSEMASYSKAMYNGKINKKFFNYFNEDKTLGYFSINMSTEGLLNSYPKLMNTMFEGIGKGEEKDLAAVGTRLFSVLIDEEAVAEIVRGDMLFVLTDLEEKEVTYTTYEYDENYESKEVTKTKTEAVPSFMFMFSSTEKELFHKIMNIGIREGDVTFENGIYEVKVPDLPFTTSINVLFKDDVILMGTSIEQLTAIKNDKYVGNVSSKHKKLISKNASTMYVNGNHILEEIPSEMFPSDIQKEMNTLSDYAEDAIFKIGKVKGNTLESELRLNIPEGKGHKNSLVYFINMIDSFLD